MLYDEDRIPTRAEILENSGENIYTLVEWLDTLNLPVGAREAILTDLASYAYVGEDE